MHCLFSVIMGFADSYILYLKHTPRNFNAELIGYAGGEQFALKFIGSLGVAALFSKVFKLSDYTVIIIGVLSYTACSISLSFADTQWKVYLGNVRPRLI